MEKTDWVLCKTNFLAVWTLLHSSCPFSPLLHPKQQTGKVGGEVFVLRCGFFGSVTARHHGNKNHDWVVVSNIFYFHPYLGKWSNLTNIFQRGWNHQLDEGFPVPDLYIQRNVSIHWLINCAFMEVCGVFILTSWTLQSENSFRNKWLESNINKPVSFTQISAELNPQKVVAFKPPFPLPPSLFRGLYLTNFSGRKIHTELKTAEMGTPRKLPLSLRTLGSKRPVLER